MPNDQAILDALCATHALALRLESELIEWGRREGSSAPPAARMLAQLTRGIARIMLEELGHLEESYRAGVIPDLETIVVLNQRALTAEELHTLLETSTHRTLHPALSPTVRTELESLGISGEVLVCGTRDASYEILTFGRDDFQGLVSERDLDECDWPLFVFRVPNVPLDWPLNHVLLYHEIGHAMWKPDELVPPPLPPELDPSLTKDLIKRMEVGVLARKYQAALASWLEEIYADAIGLVLVGPAYLLAFCRFLGSFFSIDQASLSHPPTGLRIHFLGKALRESGFYDALPPGMRDLVDAWLARAQGQHSRGYQASRMGEESRVIEKLLKPLVATIEVVREDVFRLARESAAHQVYSSDWFKNDQVRGNELSSLQIPPIERDAIPTLEGPGIPLQPARIFSATWSGYIEEASQTSAISDLAGRSEYFAQVLLGALDAAEALRMWTRVT
jgi:hypothetical protein